MAEYVFDNEPAPPELSRAIKYKSWGVSDVMQLPAGLIRSMDIALGTYQVLAGFLRAAGNHQTVQWSDNNPKEWEFVSSILAERKGLKNGNR